MFRLALFLLLVISIVSLACNFGLLSTTQSTPTASIPTYTPIGRDGLGFEFVEGGNGSVKLVLDEAQFTKIIASELQVIEGVSISDIQVYLREGQVQVYGSIHYQGIKSNSRIFLAPKIELPGQPRFVIVSAYYSLFPIPEDMLNSLQASIDQVIDTSLSPLTEEVFIDSISITEGYMTISGWRK